MRKKIRPRSEKCCSSSHLVPKNAFFQPAQLLSTYAKKSHANQLNDTWHAGLAPCLPSHHFISRAGLQTFSVTSTRYQDNRGNCLSELGERGVSVRGPNGGTDGDGLRSGFTASRPQIWVRKCKCRTNEPSATAPLLAAQVPRNLNSTVYDCVFNMT